MPTKTKEKWNKYFESLDADHEGTIKVSKIIEKLDDFECSSSKRKKLQTLLEKQKDMTMDYTDFLTKVIDFKTVFKEEDVINAFKHLDSDNKGAISVDDISKLMHRRGEEWTKEDAKELISNVDHKNDNIQVNPNMNNEFIDENRLLFDQESDSEDEEDWPKFGNHTKDGKLGKESDSTAGETQKFENGQRVQMTIGTFKKFIYENQKVSGMSGISMNTPYENSTRREFIKASGASQHSIILNDHHD